MFKMSSVSGICLNFTSTVRCCRIGFLSFCLWICVVIRLELCWCLVCPPHYSAQGKTRRLWGKVAAWRAKRWGWSWILQWTARPRPARPLPTCLCHRGFTSKTQSLLIYVTFQYVPLNLSLSSPESNVWTHVCPAACPTPSAWHPAVPTLSGEEWIYLWRPNPSSTRSLSSTGQCPVYL